MTKTFKKISAAVLSAGLLTAAVSATLPLASADSTIPNPSDWQYSMVQDYNSLTNSNDGGTDIDFWHSAGNYHKVQWVITDGKGVDSSNAVYVHTALGSQDNKTSELSINRVNGSGVAGACSEMKFNAIDVTSPTELWMWVDFSSSAKPERFRFTPSFTVDGSTVNGAPIEGAPVYFQAANGWKASTFISYTDGTTYTELNNVFFNDADLTGFKGYIRVPLSSLDSKVDWTNAHITGISSGSSGLQTAMFYNYDASGNLVDDGFYLDNIMVVGTTAAGSAKVSDLLPKANANLKYTVVQDFNSFTADTQIDYWHSAGNYHKVSWLTTAGKGADASQALYVHTALGGQDNKTSELSINRINGSGVAGECTEMKFNSIDVTSPTELWMWVDFTNTINPERFRFMPSLKVDGKTDNCVPIEGAPVYFQTADGWKASSFISYTDGTTYSELNDVFFNDADLAGFKGYIRIPLSSLDSITDWANAHITAISSGMSGLQTALYYNYDASGNLIDDGFYLDNIMVVGTPTANALNVADLNVPDVSLIETPATTTTTETETTTTTAAETTTTEASTTTTAETTTTTAAVTTTSTSTTTAASTTTTAASTTTTTATTTTAAATTTTAASTAIKTSATIAPVVTTASSENTTAEQTTAATETTENTGNPKTGEPVAAGAFAVLALAAGIVLLSKKEEILI